MSENASEISRTVRTSVSVAVYLGICIFLFGCSASESPSVTRAENNSAHSEWCGFDPAQVSLPWRVQSADSSNLRIAARSEDLGLPSLDSGFPDDVDNQREVEVLIGITSGADAARVFNGHSDPILRGVADGRLAEVPYSFDFHEDSMELTVLSSHEHRSADVDFAAHDQLIIVNSDRSLICRSRAFILAANQAVDAPNPSILCQYHRMGPNEEFFSFGFRITAHAFPNLERVVMRIFNQVNTVASCNIMPI